MGYTPVFDSVFHGTLCGKWPTLPVWLTILPMADRNGHIDMTYQAMSALTGWPIDLLKQAIAELMAPDPESRSDENEGRRLELIDAHRSWGWRVVNHGKYREKARKASYDAARTESGRDAERKAAARGERPAMSRDVPTQPDEVRRGPLSDSDSDSNTNSDKDSEKTMSKTRAREAPPASDAPRGTSDAEIFEHVAMLKAKYPPGAARENWIEAERSARRAVEAGATWDDMHAGLERYARLVKATNRIVLNPANFFGAPDRPWSQPWPLPATKAETAQSANVEAAVTWLRQQEAADAAR